MTLRSLLFSCFIFLCSSSLFSQDIHFSHFTMSPLTLNPALTGAYEGTFRVGGIYRDQWASILENQFRTPSIYVDAPIVRGFGKKDWIGVGAYVLNDQAGSAALSNLTVMGSISYHLGMGAKGNTVLSLGVQGGIVQKKLNTNDLIFRDQYSNGSFVGTSAEIANFENTNISYPDFQAGLVLNTYLSSRFNLEFGGSVYHIAEPDNAFLVAGTLDDDKLPRRYVGHARANIDFGKRSVLRPAVLYQMQAKASELNAQVMYGIHLNELRDMTLLFGAGYRPTDADAVVALFGFDYKGFKVGASYDVNLQGLNPVTNSRGGFEVGLSYIARIYKSPVVKPILFCPRF